MNNEELYKLIDKKIFMVDCFRLKASLNPPRKEDSLLNKELQLRNAASNHYLLSIIMELIIKALYELEKKKKAPFTHNILSIYNQLQNDTKRYITEEYNEAIKRKEFTWKRLAKKNNIDDEMTYHRLEEVFSDNEKTIKNFKYDAKGNKTNSSVDNIFLDKTINYIKDRQSKLRAKSSKQLKNKK